MYCASFSCAATSIAFTLFFLSSITLLPLACAISRKTPSTPFAVSGFGFDSVTCLPRDESATTPRSPSCSSCALIASTERPHVSATALIMIESPMPSSRPAYAGAILLVARQTTGRSSDGERAITERKQLAIISVILRRFDSASICEKTRERYAYGTAPPSAHLSCWLAAGSYLW